MVKTYLPGHLDSMRQKVRPKHQLLILKCYPRLPKNSAADVKPNGSELSYLLFYASSRRSKLQKVGTFLEKRTASDVYKSRSAQVLVTLQILTALLENKVVGSGSGFSLIAPFVLRIINEILQHTNDISLVEASLGTWDTFCRHQDQATLAADHEYRELYEQVVRQWTIFAVKDGAKKLGKSTQTVSIPDAIRLREAGLGAIQSMVTSDALSSESGRQLNTVIPAILSNLRGDNATYLDHLQRSSGRFEDNKRDEAMLRRQSMATVRTDEDEEDDEDARAAEGTTQDADALAEEEVGVLALGCLKAVFITENRAQTRSATSVIIDYLARQKAGRPRTAERLNTGIIDDSWATKLFETITAWTPVQDRFILLITATETLIRLPANDTDLGQHLLQTSLIDDILRSDLNLIGLSVMDILLGLIQQILRVLQLGGPSAATAQSSQGQLASSDEELKHNETDEKTPIPVAAPPSESRVRLLARLERCIADLATHIYYTDQVSDMISAILMRLKPTAGPNVMQNPLATAAAIEEPASAVTEVASNVSYSARERSHTQSGGFFSFDTARQIALDCVRDILDVANSARSKTSGGVAESRNTVPLSIWEGTQWLLRDPSPSVRRAYVDALCTWLGLETKKADARIQEPKDAKRKAKNEPANGTLARRAVSNASQKGRTSKRARSTFLQLLNLAVYENALQYADTSESDMLLLHLLLSTLTQKLGVNAVQSTLPMMFALQEEIANVESPIAKIRIASLVHGYFWHLSEVFDFEHGAVGRELYNEINRRKQHSLWMYAIGVPPTPLEQIPTFGESGSTVPKISAGAVAKEAIKPFDHRQALIDHISDAYSASVTSPPVSAPGSPGRSFSLPALDRSTTSYLSAKQVTSHALPDKVKEAMLAIWTRDGCLAEIAATAPKSISLSGSRSSPSQALFIGNHRQLLNAANAGPNRTSSVPSPVSGAQSPQRGQAQGQHLQSNHRQQAFGLMSRRLHSQSPNRRASASTNGKRSSSAGAKGTLRVDELKRVLAGGGAVSLTGIVSRYDAEDTASESLVDVEEGDMGTEDGFATPERSNSAYEEHQPVIPEAIPEDTTFDGQPGSHLPSDAVTNGLSAHNAPPAEALRPVTSGQTSVRSKPGRSKKELSELLEGLNVEGDAGSGEKRLAIGRPPY